MNYGFYTTPQVIPQNSIQKTPLNTIIPNNKNSVQTNQTKDIFTYSSPNQTKVPDYPKPTVSKPIDVSIFYIADIHGKMTNMERICAIAKQFDSLNQDSAKLKLA